MPTLIGPRMNGRATYPRAEVLSVQSVGAELLILDQAAGLIHQLNETATLIWKKLEGGLSPGEVAQFLVESYEIPEEVAARDVVDTLQELQMLNLVCISE